MKVYSNEAVTTSAVNELDAKQTRQIKKLRGYLAALAAGQVLTIALVFILHVAG